MSETTPNSKGPAPVRLPAEPAQVATLALEYRDDQPVIVPSGGSAIPGALAVVGPDGNVVALYEAAAVPPEARGKTLSSFDHGLGEFTLLLTFDDFDRGVR